MNISIPEIVAPCSVTVNTKFCLPFVQSSTGFYIDALSWEAVVIELHMQNKSSQKVQGCCTSLHSTWWMVFRTVDLYSSS